MAAEFLAHTLSLLMSAKEDSEVFERVLAMSETTDRLVQALTLEPDFGKALGAPETLADVLSQVEASGAAVVSAVQYLACGQDAHRRGGARSGAMDRNAGRAAFCNGSPASLYQPAEAFARVCKRGAGAFELRPIARSFCCGFVPSRSRR